MINFLFAVIELFSLSIYGSGVMRRNVYSSAVFAGVDLFALKFWVVLHQPFCRQKTRDTGLPDGEEDRITLRSLVLTQYRSVTDGRADGFAVACTALAKLCFA